MALWKQLGLMVVAVALVVGWFVYEPRIFGGEAQQGHARQDTTESPAAPVSVQRVRFTGGAGTLEAIGTGRALQSVTLFPEAAGQVTDVAFQAGQRVSKDQTLLQLDSQAEELAVELARARLQAARQELARYESAAGSGAVSGNEVDAARNAVETARIQLRQAEVVLFDRTLVAPFAGVVGIPQVDAGDRVTPSTEIATLDDRSALLVDFEVAESFAASVELGDRVRATTPALPEAQYAGEVSAVASRIDPQTRTLQVRARLPNENGRLRPGMSFTVRLPLSGRTRPSVPSISIQWEREGAYVWRVTEDDTAERVGVEVRRRDEAWVLVEAPLEEGERIVSEGMQRMRPGVPVKIQSDDQGPQVATEPGDGV
ncbi:hypothetical protein CKO28_19795 [Rhodovibrio sodomensis]|uniref:Efflux RND transporter periplasmic adaptor subunit n=1 Tax=Rhodovibrio sodomensis TaxID=1088 RepID=A0ABS1DII4_9PROT|nr:efflux RND transporter periplasmic adaptor subunit [Rhodovibrio sodomensis]MBK1670272.1 hypothetical protein [Rhodovibrio sodomensis]